MLVSRLLILVAAVLLGAFPAQAADVESLTSSMQARYESLQSFTAAFTQQLVNGASGETQERKGTIAFRQPGLVRWETTSPEPEILVVGQSEVWDYFPEEEAVYRYSVEKVLSSKTAIKFISGKANLNEDFWVSSLGREDGLEKLELVPKEPEPELVQAYIWLSTEFSLLQKLQIIDFFGNENTVTLQGIVMNPELADSVFSFTPPAGTDVYDNTEN